MRSASQSPHSLVGETRSVRNAYDQDHLASVELTKVPDAMRRCPYGSGKIKGGAESCGVELDFEGSVGKDYKERMTEVRNCFLGQCLAY